MGIQHFAVAFTLVLIDPLQRTVVQHAVLAIATLHLQRGVGHCLATAGINKRGAVSQGRTGITHSGFAMPATPEPAKVAGSAGRPS